MAKQRADAERLLAQLLKQQGRTTVPQLSDIAAEAINQLGGTKQIAVELVNGINESPEGSMQHTRLLGLVMDAVREGQQQAPELTRLEEEDLEKLLRAYVAEYMELSSAEAAEPATGPAVRAPARAAPQGQQAQGPGPRAGPGPAGDPAAPL